MRPVIFLTFANQIDDYLVMLKQESRDINETLQTLHDNHVIEVNCNGNVEISDLLRGFNRFRERINVFHYAGHAGAAALQFEGGDANAAGLAQLLGDLPNLKIVFLNGCSTEPQVDYLLECGVKAVIATSIPINDKKATEFATEFYRALSNRNTIKGAFTFAVNALKTKYGGEDLATIVQFRGFGAKPVQANFPWGLYLNNQAEDILDWTLESVSNEQIEEYKQQLNNSYCQIELERKYFGEINNNYIRREQLDYVINKIKQPRTNSNSQVTIITGGAGTGKSVFIHDVQNALLEANVPCLSVSCDLINDTSTPKALEEKLNIDINSIKAIAQKELVVILLDQLDALSESIKNDRQGANFIYRWIQLLLPIQNIKVIVSCREYDLSTDSILKQLQKDDNVIFLNLLTPDEITAVLNYLNIKYNELNSDLQELLRTPLHLDIFCKVVSNSTTNWNTIQTLNDLYDLLWEKQIIRCADENLLKDALYELAKDLFNKQQLAINERKYKLKYSKKIATLQTLGLISISSPKEGSLIRFFHQTFFAYTFARSFVESKQNITDIIQNKGQQNLFIRSQIRYVLDYLHSYDDELFSMQTRLILTETSKFRFHIQQLTLIQLARLSNPNRLDIQLVKDLILSNPTYLEIFEEQINCIEWFNLLENDFISRVKKSNGNIPYPLPQILLRISLIDINRVLDFIEKIEKESENKLAESIAWLMWQLKRGENERIYQILDKYVSSFYVKDVNSTFWYFVKENVSNNETWVIGILEKELDNFLTIPPIEAYNKKTYLNDVTRHHIKDIWTILSKSNSKQIYSLAIQTIQELIIKNKSNRKKYNIFNDNLFYEHAIITHDIDKENLYLVKIVREYLINTYKIGHKLYIGQKLKELLSKTDVVFIGIALEVINKLGTELSDVYYQRLISNSFIEKELLHLAPYVKHLAKKLITDLFSSFSLSQQNKIVDIILSFRDNGYNKESYLSDRRKGKIPTTLINYDQHQIISTLPFNELKKHTRLYKLYQELYRKFGLIENKEPIGFTMRSAHYGLKKDRYATMSFAQWKKTMKELKSYEESDKWYFNDMPNQEGHAEAFKNKIQNDPLKYLPFIKDIIPDESIPNIYKREALGVIKNLQGKGLISNQEIEGLFVQYIQTKPSNEFKRYLCWDLSGLVASNPVIINFLIDLVLDKDDNTGLKDDSELLSIGINSTRGSAISSLYTYVGNSNYTEQIFNTLVEVSKEDIPALNAVILERIFWFKGRYDHDAIITFYIDLVNNNNNDLLRQAAHPLPQLIQIDFNRLIPAISGIINTFSDVKDDSINSSSFIAATIVQAIYVQRENNTDDLLKSAIKQSSLLRLAILKYTADIVNDTQNNNDWEKAIEFIIMALNEWEEEIGDVHQTILNHLTKKETFERWFLILKIYVQQTNDEIQPYYFIEYLIENSSTHYKQCIELFNYLRSCLN